MRELISAADEILVIAPTLPSRFEWLASASDRARDQADERLQAVLGQVSEMEESGSPRGTVAADDPLLAFDDAIAAFTPDHILIGLRSVVQGRRVIPGVVRVRIHEALAMKDDPGTVETLANEAESIIRNEVEP